MSNMFASALEIHRRFDLKGSTVGRSTRQELWSDTSIALKELDFAKAAVKVQLGTQKAKKLTGQIDRDALFLRSHNILDYSLLIGVHYVKDPTELHPDAHVAEPSEARGLVAEDEKAIFYMGIIDILTHYGAKKVAENHLKAVQHYSNRSGVSCVHPHTYYRRFVDFLTGTVFV
mmetsp:Transcript_125187/g.286842  ORF Transcript_125187/g.286842 Transcript_125187/m.286842 type:complete len:174 (+) Transcript_125187:1196-1717(+)